MPLCARPPRENGRGAVVSVFLCAPARRMRARKLSLALTRPSFATFLRASAGYLRPLQSQNHEGMIAFRVSLLFVVGKVCKQIVYVRRLVATRRPFHADNPQVFGHLTIMVEILDLLRKSGSPKISTAILLDFAFRQTDFRKRSNQTIKAPKIK